MAEQHGEKKFEFAEELARFQCTWGPSATAEEFSVYIAHTQEAYGGDNAVCDSIANSADDIHQQATFVIQVDYGDADIDMDGRSSMDQALTTAGLEGIDYCSSRIAFRYVPGKWCEFQVIVREASIRLGIKMKRVLFCFSSLGLGFAYREDFQGNTWTGGRTCGQCGMLSVKASIELMRCARCKLEYFCNKRCQKVSCTVSASRFMD